MTTFTNIETLANEFTNKNLKSLFIKTFKNAVNAIVNRGFDFDQANILAFTFLITDGGFDEILKNKLC
mgnify:CR=1 FL=1|tara:strand:+ start:111 stop:314 length:204 start_codon:yes stop_codon:yes gene_type:complete